MRGIGRSMCMQAASGAKSTICSLAVGQAMCSGACWCISCIMHYIKVCQHEIKVRIMQSCAKDAVCCVDRSFSSSV